MSIQILTDEEELALRREAFSRLTEGCLFDLGGYYFFIAIKKINERRWQVIELHSGNRSRITRGVPCEESGLDFDEMGCLNIRCPFPSVLVQDKYPMCG